MIDHDRLFKKLLTTFFADFVEVFLPELAGYLDPASLEFLNNELIGDPALDRSRKADVVVKARFQGQGAFFIVHVEHQAQGQDRFARRFFHYFARLDEKHELPVYPVALFSYPTMRAKPDLFQVSFPDREVLRFQYRVIQLSRLRWRDFVQRPNPVAAALMAKMGMSAEERPRVKLECLRLLTRLRLAPERARFLSGFIDTFLRLNAQERLLFEAQSDTILNRTERKKVMELTTSWKEEGRQEGQVEMALRLLRRRCGPLPKGLDSKVRALTIPELEDLAEAVLDFSSLSDFERWLPRH
jgi:Domain of unknown function (DUF4351)/Putative transposase, YhgA-like